MVDPTPKKRKRVPINEEDVCTLLQKYTANQVLDLLREVAQWPEVKIDWEEFVKKTATQIESPRECQMLWRHLAYRHSLSDKVEDSAQPLDDDSDLECELEASPHVSSEVATEAATCVKVLACGSPNESSMANIPTVEGDMTNSHLSRISSDHLHPSSLLHSSNIDLPVSVQKQLQPAGIIGEGLDGNGAASIAFPSRRKRKPWTEEEDLELIAAVRRFGERNWANIVKEEFKGDRTPSQLSQRWAIIRKKQTVSNTGVNTAGSNTNPEFEATRQAIRNALKDNLPGGSCSVGNGASGTSKPTTLNDSNGDSPSTMQPQLQPSQCTNTTTSAKPVPLGPTSKPCPPLKKAAPAKPSVSADSITATAVAAGARIASASDAQNLLKTVLSSNNVRFMGDASLNKSSAGNTTSLPGNNIPVFRRTLSSSQPKTSTMKPSAPARGKTAPNLALQQTKSSTPSSFANELQQMEDKVSAELKVSGSDIKSIADSQEAAASLSKSLANVPTEKGASISPSPDADLSKQTKLADNSGYACITIENESKHEVCNQAVGKVGPEDNKQNQPSIQRSCDPSANEMSKVNDEGNAMVEVSSKSGTQNSDPMEL